MIRLKHHLLCNTTPGISPCSFLCNDNQLLFLLFNFQNFILSLGTPVTQHCMISYLKKKSVWISNSIVAVSQKQTWFYRHTEQQYLAGPSTFGKQKTFWQVAVRGCWASGQHLAQGLAANLGKDSRPTVASPRALNCLSCILHNVRLLSRARSGSEVNVRRYRENFSHSRLKTKIKTRSLSNKMYFIAIWIMPFCVQMKMIPQM